jgi:hypothetical protein
VSFQSTRLIAIASTVRAPLMGARGTRRDDSITLRILPTGGRTPSPHAIDAIRRSADGERTSGGSAIEENGFGVARFKRATPRRSISRRECVRS